MTDSLRILFATALDYMPDRVGGALSSIHELSLELKALGVETAVLCAGAHKRAANEVLRDAYGGYPVFRAPRPANVVQAVVADFRPHAAVVQAGAIVPITEAFHAAGVATIVHFRDVEFAGSLFPPTDKVVFLGNSEFTARRAQVMLGVDCHVLPSVIRLADYVTESSRRRALFVGSSPLKGIEIAFRLAASRPRIPFDFVESWPIPDATRDHYSARCREAGNIEWHLPVSYMRPIYAEARLLVVPSVCEESYARVVAEAQASGIPVLASDRGGLSQAVGAGGILIAAHAPDGDWLAALDRMWDDKEEYSRLSECARQHAHRAEMAPGRIAERFLELVTEFIAAREIPT